MSSTPSSDGKPLQDEHDALPPGTRLAEFELLRVLGVGGFGIVYLARDHALERLVALKEYMPSTMAARGEGSQVTLRSSMHTDTFGMGLRSFVNEAKLLARFNHASLVKVYRFWEANGTAYMAMPYYPGRTLKDTRKAMLNVPDEAWVRALIDPLLGAMEVLHKEDVFHRDIAPDNILLLPEGPPVLLDFGAARAVIGEGTQNLTAVLKPSYAPIEQYADVGHMRQGAWTDIYALGAVLHFVVTGRPPSPAASRAVHDDMRPLSTRSIEEVGTLPLKILKAIDWALTVSPHTRPQSVQQFRDAFNGVAASPEMTVIDVGSASSVAAHAPPVVPPATPSATPWDAQSAAVATGFMATAPMQGSPERHSPGEARRAALQPAAAMPPVVQSVAPPPIAPPRVAPAAGSPPVPPPPAAPRRSSRAQPPGFEAAPAEDASAGKEGSSRALLLLGALMALVLLLLGGAYLLMKDRAAAPVPPPLSASAPAVSPQILLPTPRVEPRPDLPVDTAPAAASMPAIKVPDWSPPVAKPAAAASTATATAAAASSAAQPTKPPKVTPRPPAAAASVAAKPAGPTLKERCDARTAGSFASCMRPLCSKRENQDDPLCVQMRRDDEW